MSATSTLRVVVKAQGFAETNKKLQSIDTSGRKAAASARQMEKGFSDLGGTVGRFNRDMSAGQHIISLVKFPAMIAGAGMATQALGALSAGAIGVAGALGPLSGLGAAGAAGYVAMGQAAGVLKLATSGLSKALGGNKAAIKALPPAGKQLLTLLKGVKKEVKGLQQDAAAGLLPGLGEGVKAALPVLKVLHPLIRGTAQALGGLAAQAGRLVGSAGVLRDLTTIGNTNVGIIRNVGNAALVLAHAFIGVVATAGPLTTWLSRMGLNLAKLIDHQVPAVSPASSRRSSSARRAS
jgi:hypothetical protein